MKRVPRRFVRRDTRIIPPHKASSQVRSFSDGRQESRLALAERATETAKMDWDAVATQKTYRNGGAGLREINRFFYLTGWTLGRRDVGKDEVTLAGWIAELEELKSVKVQLRRLAKKYDQGG